MGTPITEVQETSIFASLLARPVADMGTDPDGALGAPPPAYEQLVTAIFPSDLGDLWEGELIKIMKTWSKKDQSDFSTLTRARFSRRAAYAAIYIRGLCGGLLGACAAWWRPSFLVGALPGAIAGYLIEVSTGFVADQTLGNFGPVFAALSLASLTGAALEKPAVPPHRPRRMAIVASALAGVVVGALALRASGPQPGPAALRAVLVAGHLALAAGVRLTLPSAVR